MKRRRTFNAIWPQSLKDYGLAGQHSSFRVCFQHAAQRKGFYYVYILVSEADERLHYSGLTRDLNTRLAEHNRGKCPHTSKHGPWKIETAIAFRSEAKARRF
ncbi:MAG: GIY-YIG nuclease family protein [Candidatus Udaeobacter sp.]